MVKTKEMPYEEKYATLTDNMKFDESFILPLVKENLGDQAVSDLKTIWETGLKTIPNDASFEQKYEIAYSNWIWMAKSAYSFIRNQMGEEGIEKFDRAEVEGLKRKNSGPALLLLGIIRMFSPDTAFSMTSKQMAYQLQWLTPFSVSQLDRDKAVFDIPKCKIIDYPETEDICLVGCQRTYPAWVAEQFKVKMEFERQGNSCTCILAPLE